jgi:hypothetical protein
LRAGFVFRVGEWGGGFLGRKAVFNEDVLDLRASWRS